MTERETNDPTGWDGTSAAKLTPVEVQQKEFKVARFGAGYRMREVDEFLDRVTDTLTALIAENERLRTAGPRPAAPALSSPAGAGDREAVDAFLQAEKGFLQDLGTLVQSHAEELKTMARSARKGPAAAPAKTAEVRAEAIEPTAAPVAESATAAEDRAPADVEAMSPPVPQQPEPDGEAEPAVAEPIEEPVHDDTEVEVEPDDAVTGVVAEEPIRVEEPEPARSARADDDRDGLRELFWGEE